MDAEWRGTADRPGHNYAVWGFIAAKNDDGEDCSYVDSVRCEYESGERYWVDVFGRRVTVMNWAYMERPAPPSMAEITGE